MTGRNREARRFRSTIGRMMSRHTRETAEVLTGTFQQPAGLTRGIVQLGKCTQDVEAERSTNFRKGQSVIVVQATGATPGGGRSGIGKNRALIPGPPAKAGPVSGVSQESAGTPYAAPASGWLVYRSDTSGIFVSRHSLDGSWIEDIGAPDFFGAAGDRVATGPYTAAGAFSDGWFTIWDGTGFNVGGGENVTVVDPESGDTFTYATPAGTKLTAPYLMSDGRLYWVEYDQNTEPTPPCVDPDPCRLLSSDIDLTGVSAQASSSFAGLQPDDCWWSWDNRGPVAVAAAGEKIFLDIVIRSSIGGIPSQYDYTVGFEDAVTAPAVVEATGTSSNTGSRAGYDLDGTNALLEDADIFILDLSSPDNDTTLWLSTLPNTAGSLFVPPAQDAVYVYIIETSALEEYDTVTSSPTLQSSITIEAHPTESGDVVAVWRVGG